MTRRDLFPLAAVAATPASAAPTPSGGQGTVSLDGDWLFRLDPAKEGDARGWQAAGSAAGWTTVTAPHTWQIAHPEHLGVAWYRRDFDAPRRWAGSVVRVEFEAVYHSAEVWVNGRPAGKHAGKGYTAFTFDITQALRLGARNTIAVRVDNSFDQNMLPRGKSYDWTPDGGITRPVRLLVTPPLYIERIEVDAVPDLERRTATLDVHVVLPGIRSGDGIDYAVIDDATGLAVLTGRSPAEKFRLALDRPKLWHFDHPHLYRLAASAGAHRVETTFGIRRIEVKDAGLYLNGERVRLMGVERMAGSHPGYGMAEPAEWIEHDHRDLKELNCVFTRVHWQQDRRVLDYCDRHGILIQTEVPAWGPATFQGMKGEPSPEILENGLGQLREMIARDRNHPSIFAWGLCNEVNGQNPPAQKFVRRLAEEARRLDPHRLLTYASHSLYANPARDVAGELDFLSFNEYYESWHKGTVDDLRRNVEAIHSAFPNKMLVISEYGYCECTPDRLGGDPRCIEILRDHDRDFPSVGGLIFFCYNDYRTHVGDKGAGVMKQRVHGAVDLYGERKPSFEALRREASPIEEVRVDAKPPSYDLTVRTRNVIPAYILNGYRIRAVRYGFGNLPMEEASAPLPRLELGQEARLTIRFREAPGTVRFDVVRPTGFSAYTVDWKA